MAKIQGEPQQIQPPRNFSQSGPQLTFRGRMGTLSLSAFIPGMMTVIFRGPLNPKTLVSCKRNPVPKTSDCHGLQPLASGQRRAQGWIQPTPHLCNPRGSSPAGRDPLTACLGGPGGGAGGGVPVLSLT